MNNLEKQQRLLGKIELLEKQNKQIGKGLRKLEKRIEKFGNKLQKM